jgi:hypothetical protein
MNSSRPFRRVRKPAEGCILFPVPRPTAETETTELSPDQDSPRESFLISDARLGAILAERHINFDPYLVKVIETCQELIKQDRSVLVVHGNNSAITEISAALRQPEEFFNTIVVPEERMIKDERWLRERINELPEDGRIVRVGYDETTDISRDEALAA